MHSIPPDDSDQSLLSAQPPPLPQPSTNSSACPPPIAAHTKIYPKFMIVQDSCRIHREFIAGSLARQHSRGRDHCTLFCVVSMLESRSTLPHRFIQPLQFNSQLHCDSLHFFRDCSHRHPLHAPHSHPPSSPQHSFASLHDLRLHHHHHQHFSFHSPALFHHHFFHRLYPLCFHLHSSHFHFHLHHHPPPLLAYPPTSALVHLPARSRHPPLVVVVYPSVLQEPTTALALGGCQP
mmetsp:Transcript_2460/g.4328  ORF Transcript_2460/g.4328 Transcript_2460/m.4328 type:complete len:235 (-) Transcript_2460:22-726(-)